MYRALGEKERQVRRKPNPSKNFIKGIKVAATNVTETICSSVYNSITKLKQNGHADRRCTIKKPVEQLGSETRLVFPSNNQKPHKNMWTEEHEELVRSRLMNRQRLRQKRKTRFIVIPFVFFVAAFCVSVE